jgi:PKD repeat protein
VDRNLPVVDFQANKTEISLGEEVAFECKSKGNPTSWEWTFPGGDPGFSYEQNPLIKYKKPGSYTVILTTYNENGADTKKVDNYITVDSSKKEEYDELVINTYPNPAVNTLNIDCSDSNEPVQLLIVGSMGKVIHESEITKSSQPIDVSYFPKGMYYAVAMRNGQRSSSKFLKY